MNFLHNHIAAPLNAKRWQFSFHKRLSFVQFYPILFKLKEREREEVGGQCKQHVNVILL